MIQADSRVLADDLRALVAERNNIMGKRDRLEDKWANTIGAEAYDRNRRGFQSDLRAVEDHCEANSALGRVEGSLMTSWANLSAAERRRIIVSLVSQVTVMPKAARVAMSSTRIGRRSSGARRRWRWPLGWTTGGLDPTRSTCPRT
jgi:hypothetical protein